MCGRFTITLQADEVREFLRLGEMPPDWQPRYNIAPNQAVAAVLDATSRRVDWLRWGLIPSWAKDPAIASNLINARAETLSEKPAFRSALARRRCLILADGFYEWQKPVSGRGPSLPYYFTLANRRPFALAGLWESWQPPESSEPLRTCTIITTSANSLVELVHARMPVILTGEALWQWLADPSAAPRLLSAYPAAEMAAYPVSRLVNTPGNDQPELIAPVQE
ncbi:MAG TPA: SOS response-associated peptidase [Anaerolineaceae bacterium]|nr:SOS response-associated peptidase [Anaerolineaceae bacterium]